MRAVGWVVSTVCTLIFVGNIFLGVRTSFAVMVPFAALLPLLAPELARLLLGYGAAADTVDNYVPTLALFGPAVLFFTAHYLVLRGFYALEQTRTVFWNQCAVAATNVVVAVAVVTRTDAAWTSPGLVVAYGSAYLVGAVLSFKVLSGRVGGLHGSELLRFCVRIGLVVAVSTALAWAVHAGLGAWAGDEPPLPGREASIRVTSTPRRASASAALQPAMPAPTMATRLQGRASGGRNQGV